MDGIHGYDFQSPELLAGSRAVHGWKPSHVLDNATIGKVPTEFGCFAGLDWLTARGQP